MKNKLKNLFNILSISIIISFWIVIFSCKDYIFSSHYFHYKMYRLIALNLQGALNKPVLLTALWIACLYISLLLSIFLVRKFCFSFVRNTLKIDIKDNNRLVRLIFSTVISLFFVIYNGWVINYYFLLHKALIIKLLVNTIILPLTVLLWLLFMQGRWEKLWSIALKFKNLCSKAINIFAMILVIFLILLNLSISIDRKINAPKGPNVILISIDTLRADHLGCYGYKKNTSSNIDKFINDAVIFKNCFASSSTTTTSHGTIFTSLIPSHHGANFTQKKPFCKHVITMGEIFKNAYYRTISFNGGGQVSSKFGFDRGFDIYKETEYRKHNDLSLSPHESFYSIIHCAIEWIKKNIIPKKQSIFFMFLHTYEVHSPYTPMKEYLFKLEKYYDGWLPNYTSFEMIERINDGVLEVDSRDLNHIISTYDAEIISMDEAFLSLINFLRTVSLYDNTIIIFTSDHGEEFGERGRIGMHGGYLYDELLNVPLIIKFPNSLFKEKIIDEQVGIIDILPTLLDWLNIEKLDYFEGFSLMSLIKREVTTELFSVSQIDSDLSISSIRTNKWKWYDGMLFDLENDFGETMDVAEDNKEIAEFLKNKLNEIINSNKFINVEGQKAEKVEINKELKEQLKALGYL